MCGFDLIGLEDSVFQAVAIRTLLGLAILVGIAAVGHYKYTTIAGASRRLLWPAAVSCGSVTYVYDDLPWLSGRWERTAVAPPQEAISAVNNKGETGMISDVRLSGQHYFVNAP